MGARDIGMNVDRNALAYLHVVRHAGGRFMNVSGKYRFTFLNLTEETDAGIRESYRIIYVPPSAGRLERKIYYT